MVIGGGIMIICEKIITQYIDFLSIIGIIIIVVGLFIVGWQIYDIIEANVFPEKTLFDYLMYLKENR